MKLLCVYCGSSRQLAPAYHEAAEAVGRGLAARGWGLVYGGGNIGLMGTLAVAVKGAGGRVVGVIPGFMRERELAWVEADELVVVDTLRERKRVMDERAAAFLALPGGIGTLEELAEMLTLRYIGASTRPTVILNQDGFYDDLLRLFERMIGEGFSSEDMRRMIRVARTVDEVWPLIEGPDGFVEDPLWRSPPSPLVLYDGACNLCSGAVRFILPRDARGVFRFAALQSDAGLQILRHHGIPKGELNTLYLVENGKVYQRSEAALHIARRLKAPWPMLGCLLLLPRFLRDCAYRLVARSRCLLFGRPGVCFVPEKRWSARFLE